MQFDSVLFLCVANSARSQLAEGLARRRFGDAVRVRSAGTRPSVVHPLALRALAEAGIDARGHHSKSVDTIDPASVDLVITLCAEEACPAWLGHAARLSWPLPDPARPDEPHDEAALARFRATRDALEERIAQLAAARRPR